jgi:hypothetical protein
MPWGCISVLAQSLRPVAAAPAERTRRIVSSRMPGFAYKRPAKSKPRIARAARELSVTTASMLVRVRIKVTRPCARPRAHPFARAMIAARARRRRINAQSTVSNSRPRPLTSSSPRKRAVSWLSAFPGRPLTRPFSSSRDPSSMSTSTHYAACARINASRPRNATWTNPARAPLETLYAGGRRNAAPLVLLRPRTRTPQPMWIPWNLVSAPSSSPSCGAALTNTTALWRNHAGQRCSRPLASAHIQKRNKPRAQSVTFKR